MTLTVLNATSAPKSADVWLVAVHEVGSSGKPKVAGGADAAFLKSSGFRGKPGETLLLPATDELPQRLLLGLGRKAKIDGAAMRRAGASAARKLLRTYTNAAAMVLDDLPASLTEADAAQSFAEGLVLGAYRYDEFRSEPPKTTLKKVVVVGGGRGVKAGVALGVRIADAVSFARDLVNEPGGSLTPVKLAAEATRVAKREGLKITVLDEKAIKAKKLGGVLGVNRGSDQKPRFIEIVYAPNTYRHSVALVGKGITFDSGGLSIKSGAGMMTMKTDMAGGAAVLGAMAAVAAVKPKVKVTAYVPATDNMLGGDATRPGDVLTFRNGKTAEVLNTDAEGRLILADALSLASEDEPDAIVDLATLTGACVAALGPKIAGVMTNNQAWADQVLEAGATTGERVWQLPLPADYRKMLDSNIADMKNIGGPYGGAITAGLFLKEFVADDIPWVHIDIAGPSNSDGIDGEIGKGGTGFGVRLLLELLDSFKKPG